MSTRVGDMCINVTKEKKIRKLNLRSPGNLKSYLCFEHLSYEGQKLIFRVKLIFEIA